MEETIHSLIGAIVASIGDNLLISAAVCFIAGIVSSLSPCLMTTVPLVVGYVGRERDERGSRRAARLTAMFCVGVVITFTVFGAVCAALDVAFSEAGGWWNMLVALLLVVVALDLMDVIHLLHHHDDHGCGCTAPHQHIHEPNSIAKKRGYMGALLLGLFGGVFTAPCALPAIAMVFALGRVNLGGFGSLILLLFYALGHTLLIFLAGCGAGFINKLSVSPKTAGIGRVFRRIFGILLILAAVYIAYEGFSGHAH